MTQQNFYFRSSKSSENSVLPEKSSGTSQIENLNNNFRWTRVIQRFAWIPPVFPTVCFKDIFTKTPSMKFLHKDTWTLKDFLMWTMRERRSMAFTKSRGERGKQSIKSRMKTFPRRPYDRTAYDPTRTRNMWAPVFLWVTRPSAYGSHSYIRTSHPARQTDALSMRTANCLHSFV